MQETLRELDQRAVLPGEDAAPAEVRAAATAADIVDGAAALLGLPGVIAPSGRRRQCKGVPW